MRKYRNNKKKLKLMLIVLLVIGLGIGYAIFTQKLTIDSMVSFGSMKYDVGFTSAENGYETTLDLYIEILEKQEGASLEELGFTKEEFEQLFLENVNIANPTVTISSDKTSLTVNCELETSLKSQMCVVKATITNASAFNVALSKTPVITYDETYISNVQFLWLNSETFGWISPLVEGQVIDRNITEEVIFFIETKEFTENMAPPSDLTIPISLSLDFEESQVSSSDLVMLKARLFDEDFHSEEYRTKIVNITFEDEINIPEEAVETWDVSMQQDESVMSYIVPNETDTTCYDEWHLPETEQVYICYDLYIQSDEKLYANWLMESWFNGFEYVGSINGLELVDTSPTRYMNSMFAYTGYSNPNFTLDVSNLDTSNVIDMSYMFNNTGYNNETFSLDVSNFDTSKVTDMSGMFFEYVTCSETFTLDVSNFDTSNVTNMSYMFYGTGSCSENFTLNVSNFDTSKVTDMSYMFYETGRTSTNFTLDVSNFDTSNVTDMNRMFYHTGYNSTNFTLDVSNFDTSKVTNMSYMFYETGYDSTNLTLDVSNFDTSKVTDMSWMFKAIGYSNPNFTLDVSNFDTSNVTDMSFMFSQAGNINPNFTLDVSNFDTSNVTNMSHMFSETGYNSTKFNTTITIRNPNTTSYSYMFTGVATKGESKITLNYTSETSDLVDQMIAKKSSDSNVVKGVLVD